MNPSIAMDDFYEVEAVRAMRLNKGKLEFLIKWKDWPENTNTWEPKAHLVNCKAALNAFERSQESLRGVDVPDTQEGSDAGTLTKNSSELVHGPLDHIPTGFAVKGKKKREVVEQEEVLSRKREKPELNEDQESGHQIIPGTKVAQILRARRYTYEPLDDETDVKIIFSVLRSDGEKVEVDNRFLRKFYPTMLFDFYENRVRHDSKSR